MAPSSGERSGAPGAGGQTARRILRSSGWDQLFAGAGVVLLLLFALFYFQGWGPRAITEPPAAGIEALVVMPFSDISGDEFSRRVCEALDREVPAALAAAGEIKAVPESGDASAREEYLPAITRAAGAQAALAGTVFTAGPTARVQIRLVPVGSEGRRWSRHYRVARGDEAALEREAAEIARSLRDTLFGSKERAPAAGQRQTQGEGASSCLAPSSRGCRGGRFVATTYAIHAGSAGACLRGLNSPLPSPVFLSVPSK